MQVSDDLYLGSAPTLIAGPDSVGNPGGIGVGPMGRIFVFDIVPLALQLSGLAVAQAVAGAANLVLTAGTGVTRITGPDGVFRYVLDYERGLDIVSSGAGDTTQTATVTGYDQYGRLLTARVTLNGVARVPFLKTFKSIVSIAISAVTAGNISVGYTDKFGLPFRVTDAGYVVSVKWNATLAQDAGTFVAADTTSPATNLTNGVRGAYTPSSVANGAKRLVMAIALPAIASGPQATLVGALGVTQV